MGDESFSVRGPEERVTLQVIAERLDVSTATVSLALRDSPVVAEATRERVQKAARDMGYVYNRSAASLRTARTNIIAVVFHDVTNPYFMELLGAIEERAAERGRSILLGTYAEAFARQTRVLATLREYRPDGLIVCAAGGTTPEHFAPFTGAGIPLMQMMRSIDGLGADFVGSDDEAGAAAAFAVEGEVGVLVGDVIHEHEEVPRAVGQTGVEIDQRIGRQFQVEAGNLRTRRAAEGETRGEGARAGDLIAWLGEAAADRLHRSADERFRVRSRPGGRERIAGIGRELVLRHRS